MKIIIKLWKCLFAVPDTNRSYRRIIIWWELRRIPYYIIMCILGAISLPLFYYFISLSGKLEVGEDAVEPLMLIVAPIFINIFYTAGWISEILLTLLWKDKTQLIGPALLKKSTNLFSFFNPSFFFSVPVARIMLFAMYLFPDASISK